MGCKILMLLAGVLMAWPVAGRAQQGQIVDLELVLAIDTSTSVDVAEFDLQRDGLASAFRHRDVIRAIGNAGPNGVAVSIIEWAGGSSQNTVIGWTLVRDRKDAYLLAAQIAAIKREVEGFTNVAHAISVSAASILNNRFKGLRMVIDVSGDGTGNDYRTSLARDQAVARGIVVNGLVIHNVEYDLGDLATTELTVFYRQNVIGGQGAFLMKAGSFSDFKVAIRKKLVREITGPGMVRLKLPVRQTRGQRPCRHGGCDIQGRTGIPARFHSAPS